MRGMFQVIVLTIASFALSACVGDKQAPQTTRFIPSAADLKSRAEPQVPEAAFELDENGKRTDAARKAEDAYNDEVLVWGRDGWRTVARLCRQAVRALPNQYAPGLCPLPEGEGEALEADQ